MIPVLLAAAYDLQAIEKEGNDGSEFWRENSSYGRPGQGHYARETPHPSSRNVSKAAPPSPLDGDKKAAGNQRAT